MQFCFLYEGNSWNKEKFDGKYTRFYDEREWRYIPDIDVIKKYNIDWFLEKEEFLDYKGRREYNNKISEIIKLSFEPDDIKYIIVNSEDEILDLFRAIDNIKGDKYSLNRINILKTRIISKDQILNDF
ncbi:abortive infection system antitoxin AbiGi family protein [Clostridium perfringens]|uniref:abortive infection system antitoxin AbiGi family protein n=1 Tax=Clostridium perfringens TaxID=1502 RepID=UPI0024BD0313|nr:abortive infection system antitoxin AbiGi family protein [Clostridium perfringens]